MSARELFGLVGRRLGHSWSAQIHALFGLPDYRLLELEPEALEPFLRGEGFRGLNVTIPYKREALRLCDALSERARRVGAVNTLLRRADGSLFGDNTDLFGLDFALRHAGISLSGRKVLIFGSGGASHCCRALAELRGAREIRVISRSGPDNYENLARHRDAEILINATPLGMWPDTDACPADPALFPACRGVMDLIYNPRRTQLLLRAQELGIPTCDGLPMLVAQAAEADALFLGAPVPEARIGEVLREMRGQMTNIVLIGMPGCGKSCVGEELRRLSGRELFDTDEMVVRQAGRSIPEIFAREGEAGFRALEHRAVREAADGFGRIIVTGGGAVKDPRNPALLRANGRLWHLERELGLLAREGRPLSLAGDPAALYAERLPLYERYRDAAVRNDATPAQTARLIWEAHRRGE